MNYRLEEVGLLGIRGSFFPRSFGGSFQFRSYPIFIGEAADHDLQVDGVNFEFSDDHRLLRDQDRRFLDDNASPLVARAVFGRRSSGIRRGSLAFDRRDWVDGGNHSREIWRCRHDPRRPLSDRGRVGPIFSADTPRVLCLSGHGSSVDCWG